MSDLYARLEEIQGMVRTLAEDVQRLAPSLGDRLVSAEVTEKQACTRRSYVRAVFALIEAIIEQHKRLLLELSDHDFVCLASGVVSVLKEEGSIANEDGSISVRDQFLQLRRKLRTVYRAAEEAFAQPLNIRYGDNGWRSFTIAVKIRDRITHPLSFQDCFISGDDLDTLDAANAWFNGVNTEFVRVARGHRASHHW